MADPKRIGKYEIRSTLGKGAAASVYLAHDTFADRPVALKVLDPALFSHPKFRDLYLAQFQVEASLAPGRVVFDPRVGPHHHFIEERTGRIHDVPWDALDVSRLGALKGFEVHEYQVVMRGRASGGRGRR